MDIINVLHIYKSIKFDNKTYREYCEYNVICKNNSLNIFITMKPASHNARDLGHMHKVKG